MRYQVEGETALIAEQSYLLVAADSVGGAFAILGDTAGAYIESRNGVFAATAPEVSPSRTLTTSEVAGLTDQPGLTSPGTEPPGW